MKRTLTVVFLLFAVGLIVLTVVPDRARAQYWWNASREPVGLAPDPTSTPEAIVQVYGARAFSWRGYFGIHTWIAVKPSAAQSYTIYEVIGWLQRRKLPVVVIHENVPDRRWYGNMPELLLEKRGDGVDALIGKIDQAARSYPYAKDYTIWPGPNSNTFTAWISRAVPELQLDLPPTAIGKDYLGYRLVSQAPSGSGFQVSIFGLLGVLVSAVEGVELNLLGLSFGVDLDPLALKLPLVGRKELNSWFEPAVEN
ncbi:DUF3750 domain-containing protein [Nitrosomonas sp. Is35]|uniref:DUF3750 domain-containing protein n=1 Tax=unclassified Nitrosomonas TaxID=2609265 RepID=UPI00294AD163|nr:MULTISPECIES: DUF3750 domain-containing protein [unclassified Nitrosomonas]MDV6340792.1 DUF3750 domain-containing protein [Nitrosomonas sp. Is24]MDV6346593.1 DUF3750 domain-containing protein [Nitrosomonas sp. Is35]